VEYIALGPDRAAAPSEITRRPEAPRQQEETRRESTGARQGLAAPAAEPSSGATLDACGRRRPRNSDISERRLVTDEAHWHADRSHRIVRAEGVVELFAEYRRTRDPEIRNRLILMHTSLVRFLAAKFAHRGEPFEDLVQVGSIGLIRAVDRFDPERGVTFSAYATPTIVGEIKRYFRDVAWKLKPPRGLQELSFRLGQASETLSQRLGRSPTVAEIAAHAGITEEQTLEAMELSRNYEMISLDSPCHFEDMETDSTLQDELAAVDPRIEKVARYTVLKAALERLDNREQLIIYLRFFQEFSQAEVAQRLQISQMHVSRLERRALQRLKGMLTEAAEEEPAAVG
jgi:RNA polymerase sigma-B factor